MELKYRGSEIFKRQANEYLESARKMRQHNQSLTKWTKQAQRREVEHIPNAVMMARKCNHLSIQWKIQEAQAGY